MFSNLSIKTAVMAFFLVGACPTVAMEEDALDRTLRDIRLIQDAIECKICSQTINGPETNLAEIEKKHGSNFQENYYILIIFVLKEVAKDIFGDKFPNDIIMEIVEKAYYVRISISSPSKEQLNSDFPAFDLQGFLGKNKSVELYKTRGRVICNKEGFEFLQTTYIEIPKTIHGFYTAECDPNTIILYFHYEGPIPETPSMPFKLPTGIAVGSLIPLNFKKCSIDLSNDSISVIDTLSIREYKVYSAPNFEDIKFICYR